MQIETLLLANLDGRYRHEHMVRRFSRNLPMIEELRRHAVDRAATTWLVHHMCADLDVPRPDVTFHGGRGPLTGYCQMPRVRAIEQADTAAIEDWEIAKKRNWPEFGLLRFGDPASLGTIAHEVAHHLTNYREPVGTASHGKRWVHWFDVAAERTLARSGVAGF